MVTLDYVSWVKLEMVRLGFSLVWHGWIWLISLFEKKMTGKKPAGKEKEMKNLAEKKLVGKRTSGEKNSGEKT